MTTTAEASLPVVEQIAQAVFSRVQRLAAGYSSLPLSQVIRPTRLGGYSPQHLQVVMTCGELQFVPELSHPGNPPASAYRLPIYLRCHVIPSELDPTPTDSYVLQMTSDVRRVIADATDWHNWSGLALNSHFESDVNIDDPEGGLDGAAVPLFILFRVSEDDPYENRA